MPEFECENCGYENETPDGDFVCDDCGSFNDPGEDERPDSATTSAFDMRIPDLAGRTVRPMSFEQEISEGRGGAANALWQGGFAFSPEVHSYGSSGDLTRSHRDNGTFAHVENDSSCGGEIIYSRLLLSDAHEAERFARAFRAASRNVTLSMACGFHIHVGVQGYDMGAIENLYHAHNYLEDVLFRIGSANWSSHRLAADNDYAPIVRKGLKGKGSIGRFLTNSRTALNVSNYLASRGHCECGAFEFADWAKCTCHLPKATVEFRWPNATRNLRKVHAFAAILQSLVSACADADDGAFAHLTAMDYRGDAGSSHFEDAWLERFEWIGANLPMTARELDSVAYCVERSTFGACGAKLAHAVRSVKPCEPLSSKVVAGTGRRVVQVPAPVGSAIPEWIAPSRGSRFVTVNIDAGEGS